DRPRRDRASRAHAGARDKRRPLGHPGVRLRGRARRARRGTRRTHAERFSADGKRAHHLRVRRRGHRRNGLDRRCRHRRVSRRSAGEPRRRLRPRARECGRVRADGRGAARPAGRAFRVARGSFVTRVLRLLPYAVAIAVALVLPRAMYPVLALDILLWGLFAMSVDLLLGYVGLLAFGHAAVWGLGAYAAAIAAKSMGVPFAIAALRCAAAAPAWPPVCSRAGAGALDTAGRAGRSAGGRPWSPSSGASARAGAAFPGRSARPRRAAR